MSETVLEFRNVSKSFPGVKALDDVSFSVKRGEVHVLFGENGAGKSTIIKILTGVYEADSGEMFLDGEKIHPKDILQSRELGIGTVFQENSLELNLNVAENIFLTREIRNGLGLIDWKKTYKETQKWIQLLGLDISPGTMVKDLSVAEQQIVEIAKVVSQDPKIIILDEPTSALSDKEVKNFFRIVKEMQARGITFIFISHRMDEIKEIGDSGTILRDGKVAGKVDDISAFDIDRIISVMVGRPLKEKFPKRNVEPGEVMFEVEGLNVNNLIYDIGFKVRKGEVIGLAGLVGAGRTTTAKAIVGAIEKSSGTVKIDGKTVNINSPSDAIREKIGYLPEDRKEEGLILNESVRENLTLPSLKKFLKGFRIDNKRERRSVEEYRDRVHIKTAGIERWVRFLSGGNQQKVVFAKWLCAEAKVYIFDEPTRGIDVGAKSEIYKIINELAADGAAIIVISSELPEILGVCDRVIVLHEGRISGEIDIKEASQEKIMSLALGEEYERKEE